MSSINVCISIFVKLWKSCLIVHLFVNIFHHKRQFLNSAWTRNAAESPGNSEKPGSECRSYRLPLWFPNYDKVTQLTLTCQDLRSKHVCSHLCTMCQSQCMADSSCCLNDSKNKLDDCPFRKALALQAWSPESDLKTNKQKTYVK